MPVSERFQCLSCGHQFVVDVLTKMESEEARRENKPVSGIHCPKCNRKDVRKGWS